MPLLLCFGMIWAVPFSKPMPEYWRDATQLVATGKVSQHFTPAGYPAVLAVGMWLGRSRAVQGAEMLQVLIQVGIVLLSWGLLRRFGAGATAALCGAMVVAVHPELLVTVTKVWDVSLSTGMLLAVVALMVVMLDDGVHWGKRG